MRICIHCRLEKELQYFYTNGPTKIRSECKDCTKLRQKATRYGVSIEFLEVMYAKQENSCAICQSKSSLLELAVDHDHSCCPYAKIGNKCGNCVRGLLCHHCNSGIGSLREDAEILHRASTYLLKFKNILEYHD